MAKTDKKQPWLKFYPSDWSGDRKLHMCSIGARGLWLEMMCVMHEADPYGHLVTDGKPVNNRQIASLVGISLSECGRYLMELESAGVYSRTETKTIYSRRMVKDKEKAEEDRKNGKGGGNPKITKEDNRGVNPTDKAPDKAQSPRDLEIAVAETAREPLVSNEARDLADELLEIAGHSVRFVPPGWCGAAMRVHTWLANGWPREIIISATRAAAQRKRGAPANSVQFFEAAIAEEVARQAAPLPEVEIRQSEKITVTQNGRPQPGNIIQAADRLLDKIRSFDAGPGDDNGICDGTGQATVRLLSKG